MRLSFQATTYQNRARTLLKAVNAYRAKNGVGELVLLNDLEKASIQRAAELFVFFDHDRPDLTDYDTAASAYDSLAGCEAVSELIAAGYAKPEEVLADWTGKGAKLLLDADFTHAGVACVFLKGSANEYYWEMMLQRQPEKASLKKAAATVKAGSPKNVTVEIAKGMYERADNSHRRFVLRADDLTLKTKTSGQPTVYLYDRYEVKLGKCDPETLTYKASDAALFTVDKAGTVKKKKNGVGSLTVKCAGLEDAVCKVTIGASAAGGAVTAATIDDAVPELTMKAYTRHVALSAYVKGASGYVLYRSTSKTGTYAKVEEAATTQRWSRKLEGEELSRAYYYKVRAYKNSNGKRVYSAYSDPVKVAL